MKFIKTMLRRVIISAVREGRIKRVDATGLAGEELLDREYFQHYGISSRPKAGAEGILLGIGNVFYLIASDDRRYRVSLQAGEVALYTDEGDKIHFRRGNVIEISSGGKVTVNAPAVELAGGSLRRLIDERFKTLYDAHTHLYNPGPGAAAPTAGPAVPLDLAGNATAKTRAS